MVHPLVQQAIGLLLREGEIFGAKLVQLSGGPEPPQGQRWVRAARDDEVDVLWEVLHEEGHRPVGLARAHVLVVVEDHDNPTGQLGEPVYERGKRRFDERPARRSHSREDVRPEVYLRQGPAQRLRHVPPQPDRVVVALVEGDPGEGRLGLLRPQPVGKERGLAVAGGGAQDAELTAQAVVEEVEQFAADQLLWARQRRPELGLEHDHGRIFAWLARGPDKHLLRPPAPASGSSRPRRTADGAPPAREGAVSATTPVLPARCRPAPSAGQILSRHRTSQKAVNPKFAE